ncbi:MAG: enoyl-CoA hydratase/isomerase family protein [Chloroflexi bacterium]|nr:enoyl-CoA hydratase/isomerase family protein [Chloroflexota bacterium]
MSAFVTLLYEKEGPLATVSLNRPRALNAYNIQMRDELYQVLGAIRDDPDVSVAVFRGEGKAFCAGADLTEFGTAPSPTIARRVRWERDVWGLFLGLPQPCIAALHGHVLGSGLEMALCCDLRLAAPSAQFGLPETGLGFIPAAGATQTLPRTVPPGVAQDMLLRGRRLDAEEACRVGLVYRVVPEDRLWTEALALAQRLASLPQPTLRAAKAAVVQGLDLPLEAGLALERRLALTVLE